MVLRGHQAQRQHLSTLHVLFSLVQGHYADAPSVIRESQGGVPSHGGDTSVKYHKDRWISSFEDVIVGLQPHMSARVLATIAARC